MTRFRHAAGAMLLALAFSNGAAAASGTPATGAELLADGQIARAVAQLEQALGRNPFDPVVLNNLAVAYAEGGDWERAQSLLRRAARLAPGDPAIEQNLRATDQWLARLVQAGDVERRQRRDDEGEPIRIPPPPPALWP
ncbi:tetratricopeptide repeat protein [Algiphilus sp.]|uniref:tetratricopeptide repeat protein n=1 Tax=Algiphilus sp. TaxID=1872431 RepID=UPI0025BC3E58|nr:tetratricopeptide repeat protein [Algiphilus sp.]MCK5770111.1 tetratricopeptide repeat protein [Algiphilus sp.]